MKDTQYIDPKNWIELQRQYIFGALMPFVPERPIDFFIPDSGNPSRGEVSNSYGNFSESSEQKVIISLKRRKVLILTSDELCKDLDYTDVTVAKIYSIKPGDRDQEWYKELLVKDRHPLWAYLHKEITGQECFVDLTSVTTIGKTMLLSKKNFVPSERMNIVEDKFRDCLALGVVKSGDREIAK